MKKLLFINILIISISSCGIVGKKKDNSAPRETSHERAHKSSGQEAPYHYRDRKQEETKKQKTEQKQNNSEVGEEGAK